MSNTNKLNIRHSKNLSATAINESLNRSQNSNIYQPMFGEVQSQNSTPSQSQFNTLKKTLGTNVLNNYIPANPLRKPKNSPKQLLNLSGSETRQQGMLQQQFYYSGVTTTIPTGSLKGSRQESYGSGISEDLMQSNYASNKPVGGIGSKLTPKQICGNSNNSILQEQSSLLSSQNGLSMKQFQSTTLQQNKLYAQVNEQLKQGKQLQQQQEISKILGQNSFPTNSNNSEKHLSHINQQNKPTISMTKNASSCSPDNKKYQPSPTLSFTSAMNYTNSNKQGQKSTLNTTVSGDNRQFLNSSGSLSLGNQSDPQSLQKKYSGDFNSIMKQTQQQASSQQSLQLLQQQQQNAQSPLKYIRPGASGLDTKLSRNQMNNNSGGNLAYPLGGNGYLGGEVPARARPAPSQGERSPFQGVNREKSPLVNSRTQLDNQVIAMNQIDNLSAENRGITPLKNKEGVQREAIITLSRSGSQPQHTSPQATQNSNTVSQAIQMQPQTNSMPQQLHHRSTQSMSGIKLGITQPQMTSAENIEGSLQKYSKDPQQIAQQKTQGFRRTPSNLKQPGLNFSMHTANSPSVSNGMYYLSNGGNNSQGIGSNNNCLNQTYANHSMSGNNTGTNQQSQYNNQQQQQFFQYAKPISQQLQEQQSILLNNVGSSHLKSNQNTIKPPELSVLQMRQLQQVPTTTNETMKNSQSGIATTSGNRSRSPVKKESAKGGQDFSESFLSNYERNPTNLKRKQSNNLKELVDYWQGIQLNKTQSSEIKQSNVFSESKQQEYLTGLLKLKEYDNDLEEVIGLIKNLSNEFFKELAEISTENLKKEQESLKQIEEFKSKLSQNEETQKCLKIDLEKSEKQQVNLTNQLATQQQQIQMQLLQQQQLQQIQIQQQIMNPTLDSKLQEEMIIEYRQLQLIAEEQNKEIEMYKEREGQIKELLLEFSKKGLIRIDENGDAFIRQINNNQLKHNDSEDNNSGKREEYKQCKLHLKELISEQIGNNSVNGEQLADNSRISDSEESSFGFIGKVHMGYDDYEELDPISSPVKKVNENIRDKLKLNMAQVEETQKLIEEQQAIEDQKEKEILILQQKQQQLKKQGNKEIAKLQKTSQLKTQQLPKQQFQQQMSPQFNSNQVKSPAANSVPNQIVPIMGQQSAPAIYMQPSNEHPKQTYVDNPQNQNILNQQVQKIASISPQSPQYQQIQLQQQQQQQSQQQFQYQFQQQQQQNPLQQQQQQQQQQIQNPIVPAENIPQMIKPVIKKLQLENLYQNSTVQPKTVIIDNATGGIGEYQKKEIQDISGMGYHDEFMSRLDEFSQSWRNAAERERKQHTQF